MVGCWDHARPPVSLRCIADGLKVKDVLRTKLGLGIILIALSCSAQQMTTEEYYQTQVRHLFDGLTDPPAANARVFSIYKELVEYTDRRFPVYPFQQYTAGQATLQGIYLDISIAADPDIEVTRFWLAHEWGHMMHGDPLNQLTPVGQYRMFAGGSGAEDSADRFAARFMRVRNHDIGPILDFFCSAPDSGSDFTHSSGLQRALNVAVSYGLPDRHVSVPCAETPDSASHSSDFTNEVRRMADASRHNFSTVKGAAGGNDIYESTVKLNGFGWRDLKCEFDASDASSAGDCSYVLNVSDQSQVDSRYEAVSNAVDAAVPGLDRGGRHL